MAYIPLNALRTFEAVARLGSFQGAADALGVTQSAVSHQIRNLEDWLGVPLFDRSGRRPNLNPQAADLVRVASLSFREIEVACNRLRLKKDEKQLVIAAIPSIATSWLIPRLSSFRTEHPEIDLRVIYALYGQDIDFNEVDLAFTFGENPADTSETQTLSFLSGASAPVCSNWVLEKQAKPITTAEDFLALGLLHDTDTVGWEKWFLATGENGPNQLKGPIFDDFNMLRAAALSGQGAALCPLALCHEDLVSGRLVQLSKVTINAEFCYSIQYRKSHSSSKTQALQEFVDWALASRVNSDPLE